MKKTITAVLGVLLLFALTPCGAWAEELLVGGQAVGIEIEADGVRATVLKRRKRRVTLVRLEVLERPGADTDEELLAETDEAVEKTEEDDA